ncbi:uncharacterized protein TRIADDRAFT_51931 [Trichoplax adhaerens]|uniref:Mediator of RNA polymerase II transcription subunit 29 n=1 Tax=Trichoplax adhaerens TaxID=10228 RepID=B3RL98_TRIAD|nr:predicted protein [Trichoplax adhaerens]EDV28728.1 predicted protein [Trichoplax adhaerens]|eukprot:XP_002107930.1 predicted protein [Trichoplax adhaerens]
MSQEANTNLSEKTQKMQELIFNVMRLISFSLQKYVNMATSSSTELPNPAAVHSSLMNFSKQLDIALTRFYSACDQLEINVKLRIEEIKYKSIVGEILSNAVTNNTTYSQDYVDEIKSHVDCVNRLHELLSDFVKN